MSRLLLLIVLGFVAAFYFPDSRAFLMEKGAPVIDPFLGMATESEMDRIANDLMAYRRENFGRLPGRRQFSTWLDDQYAGGANYDAWGTPYEYMIVGRRSIELRSYGPDRLRGTEDDLVVTRVISS